MPDYTVKTGERYDYCVTSGRTKTFFCIDKNDMDIPTGKHRGSLPWNILINGVRWECIKTGIVNGRTYDKIQNTETKELKTFERQVLLDFLVKNWAAWKKNNENKIVNSDNNYTFGQSEAVKQTKMNMPQFDF